MNTIRFIADIIRPIIIAILLVVCVVIKIRRLFEDDERKMDKLTLDYIDAMVLATFLLVSLK